MPIGNSFLTLVEDLSSVGNSFLTFVKVLSSVDEGFLKLVGKLASCEAGLSTIIFMALRIGNSTKTDVMNAKTSVNSGFSGKSLVLWVEMLTFAAK